MEQNRKIPTLIIGVGPMRDIATTCQTEAYVARDQRESDSTTKCVEKVGSDILKKVPITSHNPDL